jgi:rfaE bifunctional protein kinase chain/domain
MSEITQLTERFRKKRIFVIGDFMLDEYIFGTVERISPEAPVPVVEERHVHHVPGGAGNVVTNLRSLQGLVTASGIIGRDMDGRRLLDRMKETGMQDSELLLIELEDRPTTRKTRIIAGNQQVCRLDREDRSPIPEAVRHRLLSMLEEQIENCDAIIISDYDKGVVLPEVIEKTVALARRKGIPVAVDPQVTHFAQYRHVFILTPNHHEAGRFLGRRLITDAEVEDGGREIIERLQCDHVLITRGEKGMSLISPDRVRHVPAVAREVFDVTGAGDTVISLFTLALAAGADLDLAVELSNFGAGIVVGRIGAATLQPSDLYGFIRGVP